MTAAEETARLLAVCRQYAETVDAEIAKTETDPRKGVFWNIHNRVKITEEILTFYGKVFGETELEPENENSERVLIVTKDMFTDVISIIEKSTKDMLRLYPKFGLKEATLKKGSHLYLRNIFESARDAGLMSDEDFEEWESIQVIRNLAMHNNCVADRTGKIEVDGITVTMRVGRMMKGPIDTFAVLTHHAVALYYALLMALEKSVKV